jgi:plastocyanin
MMFHLRHRGYERDGRAFDPRRPESLVYWWPPAGDPVLVAFMYRMPFADGWPRFGRPLLGWHAHGGERPRSTLMTHVWVTADLRSAIANCMPVAALEAFNAAFRFQPIAHDLTQESAPCPDEAPTADAALAATRTVDVGDNYFVRSTGVPVIKVRTGTTVKWKWVGRRPHNVTVSSGPVKFTSPTKRTGTFSRVLRRAGTYKIICDIHGARDQQMRIEVRAAH